MRIKIDPELCNGYGNCVMTAPDVFDLDNATNGAVVLAGHPTDADRIAVDEAIADCPTRAIRILED